MVRDLAVEGSGQFESDEGSVSLGEPMQEAAFWREASSRGARFRP